MNKKIFAFDVDGTFVDSHEHVQKGHIEALKKAKAKGHILALCSGRPQYDMETVLAQCPDDLFDFLVCNNGAYFVDQKTGKKYMDGEVPAEVLKDFHTIKDIDKYNFAIHTLNSVTRGNMWPADEEAPQWFKDGHERMEEKSKFFKTWEQTVKDIEGERISQLSVLGTKEGVLKAKKHFQSFGHNLDIHIAGEIYLDVNPLGVDKMTGLEKLCKFINMNTSDLVVFGDSGNDLQMLAGAGLGVAMGNATEEAKQAADIVIGDNNSSALADKVLELI